MKICLIAEATSAGVGLHVVQLAAGLLSLGHSVDLVYSPLRLDQNFRAGLSQLLKSPRFSSMEIKIRRNPHPTDLGIMKTIRERARNSGGFDIVHCHSTKAGLIGRAGLIATGARLVYTPHALLTMSPTVTGVSRWLVARLEQMLGFIGDALIAVSPEEVSHAASLGIPRSRLFVVPNGIAIGSEAPPAETRAQLRNAAGLNESDLCVGFVGRMVSQKAPENLLRAYAQLDPQTAARTYLMMVGAGPLLPGLHDLAQSLGIGRRVIWSGEQPGRLAMCAFDVFVLPSEYEGLPYVVLEAMSQGLPVVSTSVGGISMLVHDRQNGYVVPVRRADLLATAISSIVNDDAMRRRMGRQSSHRIREFSLENMVARTVNVYNAVLNRQTPTSAGLPFPA